MTTRCPLRCYGLRAVMYMLLMMSGGPGAQGQALEPIVIGRPLPLGAADDGDLGGFRAALGAGRVSGSDFVDTAARSRSGGVVR